MTPAKCFKFVNYKKKLPTSLKSKIDLFNKKKHDYLPPYSLQKQLERQQTATLYQMYGDCLREMGETSKSMEQYNKALR